MQTKLPDQCSICAQPLQGPYCSQCGQLHGKKRPSLWSLTQEAAATFFSLEKSGFSTLYYLLTKPEKVIHNYWQGQRAYYQSPNKILFYALLVVGLHLSFVNKEIIGLHFDVEGIAPQLMFILLVLPFYSLSSWLLYHPKKYRFAEHLIAKAYLVGLCLLLFTLIDDLFGWLFGIEDLYQFDFLGFMLLTAWLNWRVFGQQKSWWRGVLFSLADLLLMLLILASLVGIIYLLGGNVRQVDKLN